MAHPVAEFRSDVATLRQQIAELTARIDQIAPPPAPADTALPTGHHVGPDGLKRDGRGNLIPAVEPEPYEVRQAAANAAAKAKQQAEHDKAREGLDGGLWRDPFGIVRTQDGQIAAAVEIAAQRADAVRQQQGADHKAWKRSIGLPTLPARVSLPVRRADPANDLAE